MASVPLHITDNDYTKRVKLAHYFQCPVSMIVPSNPLFSLVDIIATMGRSVLEDPPLGVSLYDVAFVYFRINADEEFHRRSAPAPSGYPSSHPAPSGYPSSHPTPSGYPPSFPPTSSGYPSSHPTPSGIQCLEDINRLLGSIVYNTVDELMNAYISWEGNISRIMTEEDVIYEDIMAYQNILTKLQDTGMCNVSKIRITKTSPIFKVFSGDGPVTVEDGYDVFDKVRVNRNILYVKYGSPKGNIHKIYRGESVDDQPNYDNITRMRGEYKADTISVVFWKGDPPWKPLGEIAKKNYLSATLDLNTSILEILALSSEHEEDEDKSNMGVRRIKEGFAPLTLKATEGETISAIVMLYGVIYDDVLLMDYITNDALWSRYFSVGETTATWNTRKRLSIKYRISPVKSVDIKLTKVQLDIDVKGSISGRDLIPSDVVSSTHSESGGEIARKGQYAVRVLISKSPSRENLVSLVRMLRLLMTYYIIDIGKRGESGRGVKAAYPGRYSTPGEAGRGYPIAGEGKGEAGRLDLEIRPGGDYLDTVRRSGIYRHLIDLRIVEQGQYNDIYRRERKNEERRETLVVMGRIGATTVDVIDGLSTGGYREVCQKEFRPIVIPSERVEEWRNMRIHGTGSQREVLPFPSPSNPKWFIGCPDDAISLPSVQVNKGKNKDEYPFIPCCVVARSGDSGKAYTQYMQGGKATAKEAAIGHDAVHPRILGEGISGKAPRYVALLLGEYLPTKTVISRSGVIKDPNSFLHCVCTAVRDPTYMGYGRNQDSKIAYVIAVRKEMVRRTHPGLYKQEMYDYNDAEIVEALSDETRFFDPSLFYRGVEEVFSINVFNFGQDTENRRGYYIIPRNRFFHTAPKRRDRQTICILTHMGGQSDKMADPQCELLIDSAPDEPLALFGPSMGNICYDALLKSMTTYTWMTKEFKTTELISQPGAGIARTMMNIYSAPNFEQIFGGGDIYIDEYGKMRAISLGHGLVVFIPPSQPINRRSVSLPEITANLATYKDVRRLLPSLPVPSSATLDIDGLTVIGLWYPFIGLQDGLFIPIKKTPSSEVKDMALNGASSPLLIQTTVTSGVVSRSNSLRKTVHFILQYVEWLFTVYRLENPIFGSSITGDELLRKMRYPVAGEMRYPAAGAVAGEMRYPAGGAVAGEMRYPTGGAVAGEMRYPVAGEGKGERYPTGGAVAGEMRYPVAGEGKGERYPTGGAVAGEMRLGEGRSSRARMEAHSRGIGEILYSIISAMGEDDRKRRMENLNTLNWTLEKERTGESSLAVRIFMSAFCGTTSEIFPDTALIYNTKVVGSRLPTANTVEEGLMKISTSFPSLIRGGKLFFYSPEFMRRVESSLEIYYKRTFTSDPIQARAIQDYYSSIDDFKSMNRVGIFLDEKSFTSWLNTMTTTKERPSLEVYTSLNLSLAVKTEPYIYEDPSGMIFIIQNATEGLYGAMTIANGWMQSKINVGGDIAPTDDARSKPVPHNIYQISKTGGLIKVYPIGESVASDGGFRELLYYDTGATTVESRRYGAMLRLR